MQFEEFLSVIDLLKDTKKYEAKVAELKAREQAIQDSITQLGVVGDVVKAKAQADATIVKAEDLLAKATKQAEQVLAGAQTAYDKRHTELQAREVVADQALANYNTIKNQLASREDALRAKEKEADALRAALQKQQEELSVKQVEVDERLAKLRQVMG